jgi:ABC-2 type transport system permease protein
MLRVNLNDWSFLFFGYLGLSFNVACYMAIGLFCSSLTKSQVISALSSFTLIMIFWLISWVLQISDNYFLITIVKELTLVSHFESMVKGLVALSDISFYISFIFFFLLLTHKSLISRSW